MTFPKLTPSRFASPLAGLEPIPSSQGVGPLAGLSGIGLGDVVSDLDVGLSALLNFDGPSAPVLTAPVPQVATAAWDIIYGQARATGAFLLPLAVASAVHMGLVRSLAMDDGTQISNPAARSFSWVDRTLTGMMARDALDEERAFGRLLTALAEGNERFSRDWRKLTSSRDPTQRHDHDTPVRPAGEGGRPGEATPGHEGYSLAEGRACGPLARLSRARDGASLSASRPDDLGHIAQMNSSADLGRLRRAGEVADGVDGSHADRMTNAAVASAEWFDIDARPRGLAAHRTEPTRREDRRRSDC